MGRTPPGQTRDRVFRFVRDRLLSGLPPTVREVQRAFHFRSVQTAREHLEALVGEGRNAETAMPKFAIRADFGGEIAFDALGYRWRHQLSLGPNANRICNIQRHVSGSTYLGLGLPWRGDEIALPLPAAAV